MDELLVRSDEGVFDAASSDSQQSKNAKKRLIESIGAANVKDVSDMLDRLWSTDRFRVQLAPRTGLVMYTVRDPFDTPFHLGEILVTEAEVVFDGCAGGGVICGDEPERALLLAAVEAVERSGRIAVLSDIDALIDQMERKKADQTALVCKLAASTVVQFESMKKEHVDFGSLGG